jgi:hypothetical protein
LAPTAAQIYARKHKGEIRGQDLSRALKAPASHPGKSSTLQPLVVEHKPIKIPKQDFHSVTSLAQKNKEVAVQGILTEVRLNESRQRVKTLTHVNWLVAQEDFCGWWQI